MPKPKSLRRGRTRPGRLRLLDQVISERLLELDFPHEFRVVDLGFGDEIATTLELQAALGRAHPDSLISVTGIEKERSRVDRASKLPGNSRLTLLEGSFESCGHLRPRPSLIRAMNVLRGYRLQEAVAAQRSLLAMLEPKGVLLEGSSDKQGHLLSSHVWQKGVGEARKYQGLVLATNFERGFAPRMFRDVLPRDLRRHAVPGEPIGDFLGVWEGTVAKMREEMRSSNQELFARSVQRMQRAGQPVRADWCEQGIVLWTPARPSFRPEVLAPVD